MTILDDLVLKLRQLFHTSAAMNVGTDKIARRRSVRLLYYKTIIDTNIGDEIAENVAGMCDPDGDGEYIKGVYIVAQAAVAGAIDHAKTLTLAVRDANGVNPADAAIITTDTDATPAGVSLVAFKPQALVLQTAVTNAVIAAGSSYTWEEEKIGNGVKIPAHRVYGVFEQA